MIKRLWGFTKVRYRGLAKNAGRAFTALALANIYLSRNRLLAQVRPWRANGGRKTQEAARNGQAKRAELFFAQSHIFRNGNLGNAGLVQHSPNSKKPTIHPQATRALAIGALPSKERLKM